MQLLSYWRSTAAYRVRIALNLKSVDFEYLPIDLMKNGGEHKTPSYREVNPQMLVPTLIDGGRIISQSLAILEYLEEKYPLPALLPQNSYERAQVRQVAQSIACDIHPLNKSGVLKYLEHEMAVDDNRRLKWYHHWLERHFPALERWAGSVDHGTYFCGNTSALADLCIVPQIYNARRVYFALDAYPRLRSIDAACNQLEAFKLAAPEQQPDAEATG